MTQHQTTPSVPTDEMVQAFYGALSELGCHVAIWTLAKEDVIHALTAALAVQPGSGWRPIDPAEIEEGADVLLFIPDGDPQVTIGHWMGGDTIDWFPSEVTTFNGEAFDTEPTHWQPLPTPPTAQEGN